MAKLIISAPSEKNTRTAQVIEPGQEPVFSFPFDGISVEREGADLLLSFDNGGELALEGFFAAQEGGALPVMELADGTRVNAADFLSTLNPALDVTTAAGPSAGPKGSGVGDYDDNFGDLIGGVDRLGSLGTTQWRLERERASIEESPSRLGMTAEGAPADSESPVAPWSYDARALLYVDGENYEADRAVVYAQVLFPGGDDRPVPFIPAGDDAVHIAAGPGWDPAWGVAEYENGRIGITLTQAGHDALNAKGGKLLEYFDVTVKHGDDTFSYAMQVVITSARDFNSSAQNAQDKADGMFPHNDVLYGEWHNGYAGSNNDGGYTIYSSTGNDSIDIAESVTGGSLMDSGAGRDTIHVADVLAIGGNGIAENIIDGGSGNDVIWIKGNIFATSRGGGGGENRILGGDGNDKITVGTAGGSHTVGIGAYVGSQNYINAAYDDEGKLFKGDGNDTVFVHGPVEAKGGGENHILGGAGMDSVTIAGEVNASGGGSNNVIDLGSSEALAVDVRDYGKEFLHITGAVEASAGGTNSILGGAGADEITVDNNVSANGGGSKNLIDGGNGDDVIHVADLMLAIGGNNIAENIIDGGSGDDVIWIKGNIFSTSRGGGGGENRILGGDGNDKITIGTAGGSHTVGVGAYVGSQNYINAAYDDEGKLFKGDGNDTVFVHGSVEASAGGENHILGGAGIDSITITGSLRAEGADSKNFIDLGYDEPAADNDTVRESIYITGPIYAQKGGENTICGSKNSDEIILNDQLTAGALENTGGGKNTVDGGAGNDTLTLNNWLMAMNKGENHIYGGAGIDSISVEGCIIADGEGSKNVIDLGYDENASDNANDREVLTITNWIAAQGQGAENLLYGSNNRDSITLNDFLVATSNGKNVIDGGDGDDTISIESSVEAFSGGTNVIDGGDGNNTISIEGSVHAAGGSTNLIKTEGGTVTAKGMSSAFGDSAANAADITSNTVEVTSDTGVAIVISAITGSKDPVYDGFAMWTANARTENVIKGGGGGDTISLLGNIDTWDATPEGERNSVTDRGKNVIKAGGGDDIIILDGKVGGSFHIDGGDGTDTLVLKASTVEEFIERYHAWLLNDDLKFNTGDDGAALSISSIERVVFCGITREDIEDIDANPSLYDIFNKFTTGGSIAVGFSNNEDIGDGVFDALTSVDYQGTFTGDLEGREVSFLNGDDSLTLTGNLANAALNMGGGDDFVIAGEGFTVGDNVTINGGEGLDVIQLDKAGEALSLVSLFDDGHFSNFEVLDMSGDNASTLTIDALLDRIVPQDKLAENKIGTLADTDITGEELAAMDVVRITGNNGDHVLFDENMRYANKGSVTYDDLSYTMYQAGDAENSRQVMVLVQSDLL